MFQTRSRIPPHFILRELTQVAKADWPTFTSLVDLQFAKETFNLRHPMGAKHGLGDKVQQISLRITDMCNLRCHTCGQWGDSGYLRGKSLKDLKRNEVPLEVYKRMVDQVVEAGWRPIWYIWGGEPTMYPGLFELLAYISERKMPIMMVSNGTNLAEHAKEIVDTCENLWLSLDGPDAAIHNQQRPGVAANHDNFKDVESVLIAVQAEKKRRKSLFPYISPISVVARYNIERLVDIYKFSRQYADTHIFYLSWWIDPDSAAQHTADFQKRFGFEPHTHTGWIGDWKDFNHDLVIDQFEAMQKLYDEELKTNTNGHNPCLPLMYPHLKTREDVKRYYTDHKAVFGYDQCVSIYMTMEIDSNGDVSLCRDYHDYVIGNINTAAIQDIWKSETAQKFRKSISSEGLMPVCRRCCGLMGY